MPTPRLAQIKSWSHSRFMTYSSCPAKAKFSILDKIKEPDSLSGTEGTRVHALAAAWVTGKPPGADEWQMTPEIIAACKAMLKSGKFPVELETFEKEFAALRVAQAVCEESWVFNRAWESVKWNDWNAAWLRVKTDAYYFEVVKKKTLRQTTVHIVDYKTGKEKPDEHYLQRSLYALGALLRFPDAVAAVAEHWYVKSGVERKDVWQRKDLPGLQKEWLLKTTALLSDTTFAPRPSPDACQWCFFKRANAARGGGQCEF